MFCEDVLPAVSQITTNMTFCKFKFTKTQEIESNVITSPALHFGHTYTRNKFQISLILNLLAHLEAFVYQNCHLFIFAELAVHVAMLAISLSVSCSLLNYNKLNKPKLQKEQELLVNPVVKHCFCVTFTFYCANFRLSCRSAAEFHFILILHTYVNYVIDRFAWQTFSDVTFQFYRRSDSYRYTNV